jgi:hypothetical protein
LGLVSLLSLGLELKRPSGLNDGTKRKRPGFSILKARPKKSSLPLLLPEKVVIDLFRKPMQS